MSDDRREQDKNWIGETLDRQTENLDAATRSRLAQMRHAALEQANPNRTYAWIGAGGFAMASIIALSLMLFYVPVDVGGDLLDEMELLTDANEPEFYMDIAFYEWLEQEYPDAG